MAKLTLTDVANLQNESTVITALSSNNNVTEIAMENTLSRDGLAPNQMLSNFDMNNYKIINLPNALTDQEPVTYHQLKAAQTVPLGQVIGLDIQAFDPDLSAVAGLITTGLMVRTGAGTATTRTLTGTANEITLTNGDGVSGNPTISLPTALTFTSKTVTGGSFNGVVIGAITPLAGSFTTANASTSVSSPIHTASGAFQFQSNGSTFAGNINTSQQWLIGTTNTTPVSGTRLTISNSTVAVPTNNTGETPIVQIVAADNTVASFQMSTFGASGGNTIRFSQAGGTAASPTATQNGNFIAAFTGNGFYTSGGPAYTTGAGFVVTASENWTSTTTGTRIDIYSSANGATLAVSAAAAGGWSFGDQVDPGVGNITATKSIKSKGATFGIGYATGAGGTVTQATNRTTGVTLNTVSGAITLFAQVNTAVSQATAQSFTVTNSAVAATDTISISQKSGTDKYEIFVTNVAAGSFQITNYAVAGTTNEAPVFNFNVIKGVTS